MPSIWKLSEYSGCNQIYMHYPYANQIMDTKLTLTVKIRKNWTRCRTTSDSTFCTQCRTWTSQSLFWNQFVYSICRHEFTWFCFQIRLLPCGFCRRDSCSSHLIKKKDGSTSVKSTCLHTNVWTIAPPQKQQKLPYAQTSWSTSLYVHFSYWWKPYNMEI